MHYDGSSPEDPYFVEPAPTPGLRPAHNVFTPISAAQRLSEPLLRDKKPMPSITPMPGQDYRFTYEEYAEDTAAGDSAEPQYTESSYGAGYGTGAEGSYDTTAWQPYGASAAPSDDGYTYGYPPEGSYTPEGSYAPEPGYPPEPDETAVYSGYTGDTPSYWRPMPDLTASYRPAGSDAPPYTIQYSPSFTHQYTSPFATEDSVQYPAPEDWAWQPDGANDFPAEHTGAIPSAPEQDAYADPNAAFYPPEYDQPDESGYAQYTEAPPQTFPEPELVYAYDTADTQDVKPSFGERVRGYFYKTFMIRTEDDQPRMDLKKVITLCAVLILMAFCVLELGKIVVNMAQSERVRDDIRALLPAGSQRNPERVELLSPDVTFAPTEPPPMAENTTDEQNAAVAQAQPTAENGEPPAEMQRTKVMQYPENPMGNKNEEFLLMQADNPDIVGRLTIPGLLQQTVVQKNNVYYLTHNVQGAPSTAGAVFMDETCLLRIPPENMLLRGQTTVEGQVFAPLRYYAAKDVEFLKQHALIEMSTVYENGRYVIFAVLLADRSLQSPNYFNYAGYPSFPSDREMETHIIAARQLSMYEIPIDILPGDRLLTLATIGQGAEQNTLVILARLLRPGETPETLSKALQWVQAK